MTDQPKPNKEDDVPEWESWLYPLGRDADYTEYDKTCQRCNNPKNECTCSEDEDSRLL